LTLIDGLEANNTAETAGVLVGSTFVRLGNPLPGGITTITTTNAAGTFGVPDQTNLLVDDRITFNLGGGAQTRISTLRCRTTPPSPMTPDRPIPAPCRSGRF